MAFVIRCDFCNKQVKYPVKVKVEINSPGGTVQSLTRLDLCEPCGERLGYKLEEGRFKEEIVTEQSNLIDPEDLISHPILVGVKGGSRG